MAVRAQKAAATRQRILAAARELFGDEAADFTLEKVATASGVSVQTVLRAYGTKETLIVEAIGSFRANEPAPLASLRSVGEVVTMIFDDYEEMGDRAIRLLADEHRVPAFAETARGGRERHRAWVKAAFAPELAKCPPREREEVLLALVAALDVYVWKLYRRDLGLGRKASESVVKRLVHGALGTKKRKGK